MPKFYDISDWSDQSWVSTGGTRAKEFLKDGNGKYWFFKQSQKKLATFDKLGKEFKYEFWSEVIAYKLGGMLGFNILQYDVAFKNGIMGCISPSMIDSDKEELIEGVKYLQAGMPNYNPKNKEHKCLYDFANIEVALDAFEVGHYKNHIIELIVFDSLIGNGDRHQENWALINSFSELSNEKKELGVFKRIWVKKIKGWRAKGFKSSPEAVKLYFSDCKGFAPIYDSGSSLGRELTDEAIELLLVNNDKILKYINKGPSEIHWEGKKVTHFKLLENLLNSSFQKVVKLIIERVIATFDGIEVEQMVFGIDKNIPLDYIGYSIPSNRKELITKIITLRFEKLRSLIQ